MCTIILKRIGNIKQTNKWIQINIVHALAYIIYLANNYINHFTCHMALYFLALSSSTV